jgi:uncharacterized membrane protein
MKNSIVKELFLIALAIVPFVYLGMNYGAMPQIVPTHFNGTGVADGFSDKSTLWFFLGLLVVFPYLLMTFLPKLDTKQTFDKFASSFDKIRLAMIVFMSILACFIVDAVVKGRFEMDIKWLFIAITAMTTVLGNYLQTIKQNYFVGIRTPWTLSDETVWEKTHRLGGKMMFYGGLLTAIALFLVEKNYLFPVFLIGILGSSLIPVVYSFLIRKK